MRKSTIIAVGILTAGMTLCTVQAQQTAAPAPATKAPQTPAAKAPAATPAKPAAAPAADADQILKTQKDKASYAIGLNIGVGMRRDSVDVDPAILTRGLKDGLTNSKALMTDKDAEDAIQQLQAQVRTRQQAAAQVAGEANKKTGDAFLAANKTKEGVVTLPSGLQYKILKAGTGPKPSPTDTVSCNYRGTLINGTEFDSSFKRNEAATFPLNAVIKGWTEALQLMPVGSKWQLFVPPDLAYGVNSPSPEIGPNSTLIFEVELLSIQPKGAAGSPALK